jgi:hypothetical protein
VEPSETAHGRGSADIAEICSVPLIVSAANAVSNSVPLDVQGTAGITIGSLGTMNANPLDTLIVTGTGFDVNAAISELLTPSSGGNADIGPRSGCNGENRSDCGSAAL